LSWIEKLYETYENNLTFVGRRDDDQTMLLPVAHSTQNAQIEVVLDGEGNFRRAMRVEKIDAETLIPVTEDSAARGNGILPHPLCDKLIYVAGDYQELSKKEKGSEYYAAYMRGLKAWNDSEYSHLKVNAIYLYLLKKCLLSDLIDSKILECDDVGNLSDSAKIQNIPQTDSFIRFRVESLVSGSLSATWLDPSLYESFIRFYSSNQGTNDLCYVLGKYCACSDKHPSKIRHTADKAKLISGNDTSGFAFRGRFSDKSQANSISYEVSQKAHCALRWLIQKQGLKRNGLSTIIAWEVHLKKIPSIQSNSEDIFEDVYEEDQTMTKPRTQKEFTLRLNQAILGYKADLDTNAQIIVLAVDAATTGRLAVTYYKELSGSDFLERINNWHESCTWEFTKKTEKGNVTYVGSPAPHRIALAAFGTEQSGWLKANDSLLRVQTERLLHSIIDGQSIPQDIIQAVVHRTSMPQSYEYNNWRDIVSIACALVKKQRNEKYKEDWNMSLNKDSTDRSYLYGRLIAVAERVEFLTFEQNEKRETNAKRLFSSFVQRPYRTWGIIEERLIPYLSKLSSGQQYYYQKIMNEICDSFDENSFADDRKLENIYILGYRHQSSAMIQNGTKENSNEHIDE